MTSLADLQIYERYWARFRASVEQRFLASPAARTPILVVNEVGVPQYFVGPETTRTTTAPRPYLWETLIDAFPCYMAGNSTNLFPGHKKRPAPSSVVVLADHRPHQQREPRRPIQLDRDQPRAHTTPLRTKRPKRVEFNRRH